MWGGLTYERDAAQREPFALRSSYFVNELTDDLLLSPSRKSPDVGCVPAHCGGLWGTRGGPQAIGAFSSAALERLVDSRAGLMPKAWVATDSSQPTAAKGQSEALY